VFGYGYPAVATIVGKTEVNCRQIFSRARQRIAAGGPAPLPARRAEGEELARRFFEAAAGGDLDGLLDLLAPDVVLHGDGGGKTAEASAPRYHPRARGHRPAGPWNALAELVVALGKDPSTRQLANTRAGLPCRRAARRCDWGAWAHRRVDTGPAIPLCHAASTPTTGGMAVTGWVTRRPSLLVLGANCVPLTGRRRWQPAPHSIRGWQSSTGLACGMNRALSLDGSACGCMSPQAARNRRA
jgi:hypothetical protein